MPNRTLANKVKLLREQKAWSQSHLAEAAGLSIRTVQRLEKDGSCSKETMLSIAAAFDVDVEEFTNHNSSSSSLKERGGISFSMRNRFQNGIHAWQNVMAITGLWLLILPVSFFLINTLKYQLGFSTLFNPFDYLFQIELIRSVSPVIFLGGLLIAGLLNLLPFTDLNIRQSGKGFLSSLHYRGNRWNSFVLGISIVVLCLMVGYVAIENISEHAIQSNSALN